jgi:hypothetical protein
MEPTAFQGKASFVAPPGQDDGRKAAGIVPLEGRGEGDVR